MRLLQIRHQPTWLAAHQVRHLNRSSSFPSFLVDPGQSDGHVCGDYAFHHGNDEAAVAEDSISAPGISTPSDVITADAKSVSVLVIDIATTVP